MTAEIAILNKEAVALASDSAVTIGKGDKIYNSANKLFTLSKYHPVGIMVFGNAVFMGIPWETIIKNFRRKLHDLQYDKLEDYADKFMNYLESNEMGITDEYQLSYVENVAANLFIQIRDDILKLADKHIKEKNKIDTKQLEEETLTVIKKFYEEFSKPKELDKLPEDYLSKLKKSFDKKINGVKKKVFEKLPL
ncbi:MAG: hypothetical protein KJ771_04735, partial [Nanoarchaeota archaeon]|nr:hypothetical protein [Nanoarchaeota archaeon]